MWTVHELATQRMKRMYLWVFTERTYSWLSSPSGAPLVLDLRASDDMVLVAGTTDAGVNINLSCHTFLLLNQSLDNVPQACTGQTSYLGR